MGEDGEERMKMVGSDVRGISQLHDVRFDAPFGRGHDRVLLQLLWLWISTDRYRLGDRPSNGDFQSQRQSLVINS